MAPSKSKSVTASNPTGASGPRVIYWFRTDLRLHDSPALTTALSLNPTALLPLWTWDPHYVYHTRVGANRWRFLLECQADVSMGLSRLNPRQKLHVFRAPPGEILPKLLRDWGATHLVFEKDTDAYGRSRDQAVRKAVEAEAVEVLVVQGRNLYDPDELVRANGGKPTMSIAQVQKASERLGVVPRPVDAPTKLPDPDLGRVDVNKWESEVWRPEGKPDFNARVRTAEETQYARLAGPDGDFGVPTLAELGISESAATSPHHGGETRALKALAELCKDATYIAMFEKPKTAPTAFHPQSTTLLSPHLHFGSLSVRTFWWAVHDILAQRRREKKSVSDTPVNLPGQLLFREMYFGAQAALGANYGQEVGNRVCRFVDWRLRTKAPVPGGLDIEDVKGEPEETGRAVDEGDGKNYVVNGAADEQAEIWFQRWRAGRTGFPWIDALMRQLASEGWIHHLGRHAVACFLTRGGCYVHWERGAEVFEEWLIDHEEAANKGNWMWLSCTAFFAMFYRVYSPIAFGRKTDPEGRFVREFVPELREYDKRFIYEPWRAPVVDQKRWGCVVRGDGSQESAGGMKVYPKPMFDFDERRRVCVGGMKRAYEIGMYGDDGRVRSGEWRRVFGVEEDEESAGREADGRVPERPQKRARKSEAEVGEESAAVDFEQEDVQDEEGVQNRAGKVPSNATKKGETASAEKQGTLDALVGWKKAKK